MSHPIFSCGLYTDEALLSQLKADVKVGFTSPEMTATGIPPHVALMHCMEDLRSDFAVLQAKLIATIKEAIEENGIAAGMLQFHKYKHC